MDAADGEEALRKGSRDVTVTTAKRTEESKRAFVKLSPSSHVTCCGKLTNAVGLPMYFSDS